MLFNFISRRTLTPARPYITCCHALLSSSSSFTTKSSNKRTFTVTYLINSCGVAPESANSSSRRLDLTKSPNTADSVLALLNNQGFTKSQVSKAISKHPRILLSDPQKTLLPNFKILKSLGLSNADIFQIVTAIPKRFMNVKFQDTAPQCIGYLRTVLGSDDKVIRAIKRFPLVLTYDLQLYAAENIRMLLEAGVPDSKVRVMLAQQPRTFFTSADRFRKVVMDVKEMGFEPSKYRFLLAIQAVRSMSKSTWDMKLEVYKKWGWSKDEVFIAFDKYPACMMASVDKITGILDFLGNTMGWERSYILRCPIVFCFSLEKRLIPRCLVYRYLEEKGLIEKEEGFCFTKWLMYSETKFLKWVVKRYEAEAHEILKLYRKHLDEAKRSTTSILRNRAFRRSLGIYDLRRLSFADLLSTSKLLLCFMDAIYRLLEHSIAAAQLLKKPDI
ncbi:hypothetical protein QVD17_40321 [Tagetes erecta]|uniref:Mitochondrial transcription termination factor n=1 Tax=Tagetes erecta TaxID=13708 RepID=A0AAD8JTN9_TARER|nr:hypothetical protein QVD17_40321 [Tagetes erecta]